MAVLFDAVSLTELLELVAALGGGPGRVIVAAASSDGDGDLLPLAELERSALEGVPFLLVGSDEVGGLLCGPRYRLGFPRRWRCEGQCEDGFGGEGKRWDVVVVVVCCVGRIFWVQG